MTTKYDWQAVQRYYDEGHSMYECMKRYGFARASWSKAVIRGNLQPRPRVKPLEEFVATSRYRGSVKRRLLREGTMRNQCSRCGLSEWRGCPISIQIDHINGDRDDHRLENLRMLCPNCHSQMETWGRKARRCASV